MPTLFALALLAIKQPQMAGFAVFGTFAHLVMVDYDPAGRVRSAEAAMLTVLGAAAVSLGTLVSPNIWLTVGGAIAAGFLVEIPVLARRRVAAVRTALLLVFLLAAAVPATAGAVLPRLAGWLLAGFVAQPILLLVWFPLRAPHATKDRSAGIDHARLLGAERWVGHAGGSGLTLGLAALLTRVLKLEHAFWVVLGVLPLLHMRESRGVRTLWQEQAGTLIGFMIGTALAALIGSHQAWYWAALPLSVFASAYISNAVGFMAGQTAFTVFAIVLFCILLPQQRHVGIVRVEDIAIGGAVGMAAGSLRRLVGAGLDVASGSVRSNARRNYFKDSSDILMSSVDPPRRARALYPEPALMGFEKWAVVGVVAFALFMDYLIYGLIIPLTPYSPAIGGAEQLGLLYGGYSAGVLAATPLFGYLGDRIGCRRPMILGVALSALTVALFALATNFYLLLLGRLLQGAAASATWTAGLALIAAHYPHKRVEMIGWALMGSTAGSLLGPVIGGTLYQVGGYILPFAVTGILVAIDAGLRVFLLPRDRGDAGASPDLRALLFDRSVLVAAAAVVLAAIGWGIVEPLLPTRLGRSGVSPAAVGLIFTAGSIAYGLSAPVVSRVSERVAIRKIIIGGTIAMAAALPLLSLFRGAAGAAVGMCLVSVCYAFMLNPTSAELGNAVDRRGLSCYAAVYAVYNIAYAVGQMAASAFASTASSRLSFFHTMLAVGVVLVVFAPLLALRDSPSPESTAPIPTPQEDREHGI